jgi:hypothetical protein
MEAESYMLIRFKNVKHLEDFIKFLREKVRRSDISLRERESLLKTIPKLEEILVQKKGRGMAGVCCVKNCKDE